MRFYRENLPKFAQKNTEKSRKVRKFGAQVPKTAGSAELMKSIQLSGFRSTDKSNSIILISIITIHRPPSSELPTPRLQQMMLQHVYHNI